MFELIVGAVIVIALLVGLTFACHFGAHGPIQSSAHAWCPLVHSLGRVREKCALDPYGTK